MPERKVGNTPYGGLHQYVTPALEYTTLPNISTNEVLCQPLRGLLDQRANPSPRDRTVTLRASPRFSS